MYCYSAAHSCTNYVLHILPVLQKNALNRERLLSERPIGKIIMCVLLFLTLDAGLLARSQYSEGPATGHLDTGFSWFPCA